MKQFKLIATQTAYCLAVLIVFAISTCAQFAVVDVASIATFAKEIGVSTKTLSEVISAGKIGVQALTVSQDIQAATHYMNSFLGAKQALLSTGVQFVTLKMGNESGQTAALGAVLASGGARSATSWVNSGVQLSQHGYASLHGTEAQATLAQLEIEDTMGASALDASGACSAWENANGASLYGLLRLASDTSKLANSLGVQYNITNLFHARQAQADQCLRAIEQAKLKMQMAAMMRQRNDDATVLNRAADYDYLMQNEPVANTSDPAVFVTDVIH